jgi:hypothetical protein
MVGLPQKEWAVGLENTLAVKGDGFKILTPLELNILQV